jgi:two-component system, OmpR family, response regulator
MAGATVLLVDDRDTTLEAALQFHGFDVQTVRTGRGALTAAADPSVDAVLLEVDLADIDGFEVCRRLRSSGDTTPLVFLSGRASVEDRVRGIAAGADDYIPKPVDLEELVARLRVAMRRAGPPSTAGRLGYADLELNEEAHLVTRRGVPVSLSPTEYRLLRYFLEHAERVVSRAELLDAVWHRDEEEGTNVVDTYVGYLRRKVDHVDPKLLQTVRGFGYILRLGR